MPTATTEKNNIKSLHSIWFVGNAITVSNALLFFISRLLFYPLGIFYRMAYISILITYGIVLYNQYKPLDGKGPYFKRMLLDENFQYLVIAIYFLFTRRIAISLLPFFIYSVFHVAEYIEMNLYPGHLGNFVNKYYDESMKTVVKIEIGGVLTRLVLGLFALRSTLLSVLVYVHFLRMRYYMSKDTRDVITGLFNKMDRILSPGTAHARVPPVVSQYYQKAKIALTKGQVESK